MKLCFFFLRFILWNFRPLLDRKALDMKGGERWVMTRSKEQQAQLEPAQLQDSANMGRTLPLGEPEAAPALLLVDPEEAWLWCPELVEYEWSEPPFGFCSFPARQEACCPCGTLKDEVIIIEMNRRTPLSLAPAAS